MKGRRRKTNSCIVCMCTLILPLIVKSSVDIFRDPNPALPIIRSDIEVVIGSIVGNSISLPSRVPDQGARINSVREQLSSCPRDTFILGDVDGRLSSMRKHNLQLLYIVYTSTAKIIWYIIQKLMLQLTTGSDVETCWKKKKKICVLPTSCSKYGAVG